MDTKEIANRLMKLFAELGGKIDADDLVALFNGAARLKKFAKIEKIVQSEDY